jgi:type II secretory pathway pseudopilin PulG
MKQQRGFALLLVFVMAAAIAITLYMEMPRVAFEAQRNKEALLIERGEQYQRAIQLYVRKFKKYPIKIEDLEETNQIRFLRKRYIDPMTGKSEWRMIHMGPGGVFTDSLTHKPPSKDKEEQKAVNTFTYEAPAIGSTTLPGQSDPAFPQARPSERAGFRLPGQTQPGQPGDPANPQQPQPGYPQPGVVPGYGYPTQQPGAYPPQPGAPGMPQQQQGFNPLLPAGLQGTYPGAPVNSQTGGVSPSFPYSTQPGAQGAPAQFAQPGMTTTPGMQPGQNQALNLINQILTTPRAGGPAGTSQPMGGMQIGPGIAGVASTVERTGIKIYNDKVKYNEWEFIYDLTKDTKGMAGTTGIAGAPQQGTQTPQAPGTQSPFGGPTALGNQPAGFTPQPQPQFPQQQPQYPQQQFQPQQQPQYPPQPPQPQPQPVNPP